MFRSSDLNPAKRSQNELVMAPEQTVNNADFGQQRSEVNHDSPGRVDDSKNHSRNILTLQFWVVDPSSRFQRNQLNLVPPEFDETGQFFTHEEPDLRHAVHAAFLACLEESELPSSKSASPDKAENMPTGT